MELKRKFTHNIMQSYNVGKLKNATNTYTTDLILNYSTSHALKNEKPLRNLRHYKTTQCLQKIMYQKDNEYLLDI